MLHLTALYKKKKSACGIRPGLKKRSFNILNAFYIQKRIKQQKKAPAALGQALKNEVTQIGTIRVNSCFV